MRTTRSSMMCALVAAAAILAPVASQAQLQHFYGQRAARATELPLGAWGPYVAGHREPCYLADRLRAQLFAFPIIVGQRRTESILAPEVGSDGKSHLRLRSLSLVRRSLGLSPAIAQDDDIGGDPAGRAQSRRARTIDADADGLLWSERIPFPAAGTSERTAGSATEPLAWGAGTATVTFFPCYAAPDCNGLAVRVSITNASDKMETWYTDLLGGMATLNANFLLHSLDVDTGSDGRSVALHHPASDAAFALGANGLAYSVRGFRVDNSYFDQDADIEVRDALGVSIPHGVIAAHSGSDLTVAGLWGLTRVDNIAVAPGATVTFTLCIGKGPNLEVARRSASVLAALSADADVDNVNPSPGTAVVPKTPGVRESLYQLAMKAHTASCFVSGNSAIDRLLAQSLVNVPFQDWRRIGIASRLATLSGDGGRYRADEGGAIALAWSYFRPDFAAAQLNAFFRTQQGDASDFSHDLPSVPANLFALWELYQQTHDREMLRTFYPLASRSYRAFVIGGRIAPDSWLFSWATASRTYETSKPAVSPTVKPAVLPSDAAKAAPDTADAIAPGRGFDIDYSAYVIRSARIMALIAAEVLRLQKEIHPGERDPEAEVHSYELDAENAVAALRLKGAEWGPNLSNQDLLALTAGSGAFTEEQCASLLEATKPNAGRVTGIGLAGATARNPLSLGDRVNGKVDFLANWMLWKSLLDQGLTAQAQSLASNLLNAYRNAVTTSDVSPEYLDSTTGAPLGAGDYSGFACALVPMWLAYHRPGTVSSGFDITLLDHAYDADTDTLKTAFRSADAGGLGVVICGVGKPRTKYSVTGSITATMESDSDGVIVIVAPKSITSKAIRIEPLGTSK